MVRHHPVIRTDGAEVLAVAVTPAFSQIAFAAHLGAPFPMLWDWDGRACDAFGVRYDIWKGHKGVAKRALFVVDRQMTVQYTWWHDDAEVLPDLDPPIGALRSAATR